MLEKRSQRSEKWIPISTGQFLGNDRQGTHLELSSAVGIEGLLVDVAGKSQWIEESGRGDNSELVLIAHLNSRSAGSTLGRGERSSRAEEDGEEGELHLCSAVVDKVIL
jgi:hypothetical protein